MDSNEIFIEVLVGHCAAILETSLAWVSCRKERHLAAESWTCSIERPPAGRPHRFSEALELSGRRGEGPPISGGIEGYQF